jgi:hypothetical protein
MEVRAKGLVTVAAEEDLRRCFGAAEATEAGFSLGSVGREGGGAAEGGEGTAVAMGDGRAVSGDGGSDGGIEEGKGRAVSTSSALWGAGLGIGLSEGRVTSLRGEDEVGA